MSPDYSQMSMLELFRLDAEQHLQALATQLLEIERADQPRAAIDACLRAAHSIKGSAKVTELDGCVRVAHAMEDCLAQARAGTLRLHHGHVDHLLRGVDLLQRMVGDTLAADPATARPDADVNAFVEAFAQVPSEAPAAAANPPRPPTAKSPAGTGDGDGRGTPLAVRTLRIDAELLDRLLALAGEARIASRALARFGGELLTLKRQQRGVLAQTERLVQLLQDQPLDQAPRAALDELVRRGTEVHTQLHARQQEMVEYERQLVDVTRSLYDAALAHRLRPFADLLLPLRRLVRDLARELGRQVELRVEGEATRIDRDLLQLLEAPLGHLLRNAVDHGIEPPAERVAAGKPPRGMLDVQVHHHAGLLHVSIADDGRGVDLARLRQAVVGRGLASEEVAAAFGDAELLEFLFLPGFTLSPSVTEVSGRGIGLDAVQDMLKRVRGTCAVVNEPGRGARWTLRLPIALSLLRALLVQVGGEPYALPLARVGRVLRVPVAEVEELEGRQFFQHAGRRIGLVPAAHVLQARKSDVADVIPVVLLGEGERQHGLAVEALLGERELVLQRLDVRLGKVPNVAAGALMPDGSPLLVLDIDDLLRSVDKLVREGKVGQLRAGAGPVEQARKRVLVVDDSLTVRELQRKLLVLHGYDVEVASDGMDGWNAVRNAPFDLLITDVDMPRMDGIELVTLLRQHVHLRRVPVLIVSYKDRESDRQRGLVAGADYYLVKSGFHDEALIEAVRDLIGPAHA